VAPIIAEAFVKYLGWSVYLHSKESATIG
jgi:hypothetical protein